MRVYLICLAISSGLSIHLVPAGFRRSPFRGLSLSGLNRLDSLESNISPVSSDYDSEVVNSEPQGDQQSGAQASLPLVGNATIEQYIDHNQPGLGKFTQHYSYNATYWKPGGPIILMNLGENYLDHGWRYGSQNYLPGMLAKELGGAALIVENRYLGKSKLFEGLYTPRNLKYLTLEQVVSDMKRFPCEVKLPFDPTGSSKSPRAPWILLGASVGGNLAVWTERFAPGAFWTIHASSATVQSTYDFWQQTVPMSRYMPRNCSADFSAIFNHIDDTFYYGTKEQQQELQAMFGMQDLEYYEDFAFAVSLFIQGWLNIQPFEDFSLSANMTVPPETGIGLEKALPNYAQLWKDYALAVDCPGTGYPEWSAPNNSLCFDYHTAKSPLYAVTVENADDHAYEWMRCTWPLYYNVGGPPRDWKGPVLWSRAGDSVEALRRQCGFYFPSDANGTYTDGSAAEGEAHTAAFNAWTGGWNFVGTRRVLYVNGERDNWREASVASDFRPGGRYQGTSDAPSIVIEEGYHCSDMYAKNGEVNENVKAAQDVILAQHKQWIQEF